MNQALRQDAQTIWRAGLHAVHAGHAVERWLVSNPHALSAEGDVWLVGAGKASLAMAAPLVGVLGDRVRGGLLTTKDGHSTPALLAALPGSIEVMEAAHPVPDERSVTAAVRTLKLVDGLAETDLVICVLSGGASSLWTAPVPGVDLDAIRQRTVALLHTGVDIEAMNAERGSWSRIKNGGLWRAACPARVCTLVLSDVPGDPRFVGSGPTIGGERLQVVADWRIAVAASREAATKLGYTVVEVDGFGGHREVMARVIAAMRPGTAVLCGGETTLEVGRPGRGGRNQHFALDVALELAGQPGWALMSVGTDGTDGPTPDAGGLVDGGTVERVIAAGQDAAALLRSFDSGLALVAAGDRVTTGPTGTNVMDLRVLVRQ